MRTIFFSTFLLMTIASAAIYVDNFLENDLLAQLHNFEDSSIIDVKEGRYYLNVEKISLLDDKICLNTEFFGPFVLKCIRQDLEGIYLGIYDYYTCDGCGRSYQSQPAECESCGGTSFTRHEQLPSDD